MSECEICEKPVPATDAECEDCLNWARECDGCDKDIPFDEDCHVDHPELGELYLHEECVKPEWYQFTDDPEYWVAA